MFDVPILFFVGFMTYAAHQHHNNHDHYQHQEIDGKPYPTQSLPSEMTTNDAIQRQQFKEFVDKFNKEYSVNSPEYERRYEIYRRALEKIRRLNLERPSPESALHGITKYTDMEEEEFRRIHLHHHHDDNSAKSPYIHPIHFHVHDDDHHNHHKRKRSVDPYKELPKKVDWREKGVISAVRNQGKCGACWAHSVLETIESLVAIGKKSKTVEELSVQQMVDCARKNNFGCNGGNTCNLLDWLVDSNVTIVNKNLYPDSETGWTAECRKIDDIKSGVQVNNFICERFVNLYKIRICEYYSIFFYLYSFVGKETEILKYLSTHGPISAAVDAVSWQNYLGGVIQYHCDSDPMHLNHAVQIVGYDLTGEIPYYIVRNTWGTDFGNSGYMKIKVGNNLCGIANEISIIYASEI